MRVNEVAQFVGEFINFLHEYAGLQYENVTLIGFSLGAHISGVAGKKFINGKVRKIVGLDPAGPLFEINDPDNRLNPESAEHTECIHSGFYFGIKEPICQLDFYLNSGSHQPGCESITGSDFKPCSHARALEVYNEALSAPEAFYGYRCDTLNEAFEKNCHNTNGAFINDVENEVKNISGIFHVTTNGNSPFGRGRENDDNAE